MNDTCTTTRQLLSAQLDGPLTAEERAGLRAHLAACPTCRAFERDLQAGLAGIARLPRVSGSAHVREAVLAGVHPGGRSAWPRGWRDWTGQTLKIGGAVVAFALVAVILMTVFNGTGNGEPVDRFGSTGSQAEEPTATPEPIATIPATADVYAPLPCHQQQVTYEVVLNPTLGAPATNIPSFVGISVNALKSTGGALCQLTAPVSLTISDATGTPIDIQGNPAMATIDATLGAEDTRVEFAWMNWCGAEGPFNLTVEVLTSSSSGSVTELPSDTAPRCEDDARPSTLGLLAEAETAPVSEDCRGASTMATAVDSTTGGVQIWYIVDMSTGCGNDAGGTFRLEEPAGDLLEIDGNGSELAFTASEAGEFEWVGMLWTNWCGDNDQIKLEIGNEEWGFGSWMEERPTCQDAGQPSQLTILETPPADPWPGNTNPADATPLPGMTSEPPACDPATLGLTLLPVPSPGLYIVLSASAGGNTDAGFCSLDAHDLTMTITDASGQMIDVDGNGETYTFGTGEPVILHVSGSEGIIWENWCGEPGPFTISATFAGQTMTLELANGPECTDDSKPSTILGPNEDRSVQNP